MTIDHPDHPLVRNSCICPLCRNHKDQGLVLCWPCHRKEKAANRGAYSNTTETILDAREYRLSLESAYAPNSNRIRY